MKKLQNHFHNHIRFYRALLMSLLPLLCCEVYCLLAGHHITDIYIPASSWNDELFYYKQVEGIVNYGYPYGYFGFNESHAQALSFAAWSPVLFWPWILWGLLFGWNLMSPIYCNIFVMMVAVFLFVWLVRADFKQCVSAAVLYALMPLFTRYTLSAMPEATCFAMLIVFLGLAFSYFQEENAGKLVFMFALSAVMTLMRPYMIIFLALPAFLLIRKKRLAGAAASLLIVGMTGILYILINRFLAAEYFTALFDVSWLTNFIRHGFVQGFSEFLEKFSYSWASFFQNCAQGFTDGLPTGIFFISFLAVMALLAAYSIHALCKKQRKEGLFYGYLTLCFFAMWMALLLMYKMQEGSKHLLTFIAVGIFALAMMKVKGRWQIILCGVLFVCLYFFTMDYDEYELCFRTEELEQVMEDVSADMEESMSLETEAVPNYDNVVIWVTMDFSLDDEWLVTNYQILYALPEGFGISCCYANHVLSNFDTLQSKYLCTAAGGTVDQLCQERGLQVITEGLDAVIYQLR